MSSLKREGGGGGARAAMADDTEDVDDTQDCEHFETRQAFLNLCQGNHYQFDQLRRSKHTSLMVLYHLHNPDAPKFVHSCLLCNSDILVGYRYHCEQCDLDVCQKCHSAQGPKCHAHPLRAMPVSAGVAAVQLTEQQRKERQQSMQLHLQLLQHASTCANCGSKNCSKMKVCFLTTTT
jgi:E1A/CREB-binding protein